VNPLARFALNPLGLTSKPPVVGRVVTATITLVCVLIVYAGWASLRLLDVSLIIPNSAVLNAPGVTPMA
jgi:hypothetical protein